MNVSVETQELIVSALIKDSYLFSICKDEINEGYFTSPSCKVIYKALATYYKKYSTTPNLNELLITIEDCYYPQVGANLSEVKDTCCKIYDYKEPEESFIKDKITDFLRKVRSSTALKNFVDQVKQNPNLESDNIVSDLAKALEVQLSTTKVFMMNNPDQVKEARQSAVGSLDSSKIIKSTIPSLNNCLMFGGWQPSTVNMIVAPPGCFTGDTYLLTPFGRSSLTLEEIYNLQTQDQVPQINVIGVDPCKEYSKNTESYIEEIDMTVSHTPETYDMQQEKWAFGTADQVYLSEYTDSLIEVEIDKQYTIKCTPDHPFLTVFGEYVQAKDLTSGSEVSGYNISSLTVNLHWVTKVTPVKLSEKVPVYGVVDAKPFGNYAIALSDTEGVFVHNTGKSMWLINEGVNAAKQGFDVFHIFIGDMVEYDGFIRYLSCISGTPQNSLIMMTSEKQNDVVKVCNQQYNNIFDHIYILAYPSLSITVDTLIEDINKFEKQLNKDFGMIIVDYPDNLIQEGVSLYTDGGTLYSSLERMARLTKSVVLVASQPSKAYWNSSIIPLEAASDSSKKQMVIDNMLTMNTDSRGAPFGTILLAKARKGEVGKIFRFKTDYAKCKIEEIDEATFNAIKAAYGIK